MQQCVLLLNFSYEPLRVVGIQDAVRLMLRGVVEEVVGTAAELRTAYTTFHVPSVLRLRVYAHVPQRGATWSHRAVLQRDHYTCIYCGVQVGDRRRGRRLVHDDFNVDHLIPQSRGGASTWSNTACACKECNQRKADRTPHEAGMKLRWEPKTPRVRYLVAGGAVPEEWKLYLQF